MKDPILVSLDDQIAQCEARLTALRAARAALSNLSAAPMSATPFAHPDGRERAPAGHLREKILEILKTGPHTKMQVVGKLKQHGYTWSVRPAHVARNLASLRKEKKVKAQVKDLANVYSLVK